MAWATPPLRIVIRSHPLPVFDDVSLRFFTAVVERQGEENQAAHMVRESGCVLDGEDRAERMADQDNRLPGETEPFKHPRERGQVVIDGIGSVQLGRASEPQEIRQNAVVMHGERPQTPRKVARRGAEGMEEEGGGPHPSSRVASTVPGRANGLAI